MNYAHVSTYDSSRSDSIKKCVLVVSDSSSVVTNIDCILSSGDFEILVASDSKTALGLFTSHRIDYVIIDLDSIDMPGDELVYSLRVRVTDNFIPIIVIASSSDEEILSECLSAGCDDFLINPISAISLKSRLASLEQTHELKRLYKDSINEQLVAKQILNFALAERNIQFEEIKLLSRSKAVFSGDLFLTARTPDGGLHILLADFTGHGLSAAIGALPVADIFSVMTEKGFAIDEILNNLNDKLHTLLPVSMFMACIMLKVTSDLKQIEIWNGGMPDVFIRDNSTGEISQKIHSTHIALGISESLPNQYVPEIIRTHPNDQLIVFSDGIIEAENIRGDMFGYEHIEQCVTENLNKESVFPCIVNGFNKYCGGIVPDDDVTLACIPCRSNLTEVHDDVLGKKDNDSWCWHMELTGDSLSEIDPIPIIMGEAYKLFGQSVNEEKLYRVIKALYDNSSKHGLRTDQGNGCDALKDNKVINPQTDEKYLRIGINKIHHEGDDALLISFEDSGQGFDHVKLMDRVRNLSNDAEVNIEGIALIYEMSDALHYHGNGNRVEAVLSVQL